MVTKVINIEVKDGDVKKLNQDLNNLDKSFDKVDGSAKKASKSVDEVASNGGAIAILDELTGGLATRLKDSYEASKLFNFSLKGTRTALIATGIGAFVVALGAIVAYWDDIVGFITGANKELERQATIQDNITKQSERDLKILDQQDNILKLQGKSQQEINKLKKDSLKLVIQEQEESLKLAQQRLAELKEIQSSSSNGLEAFFKTGFVLLSNFGLFVDKIFGKLGLDTGFGTFVAEKSASIVESVFGTQEDIDEATQRVQDLEDAILSSRNRLAGIRLSELEGTGETAQVTTVGELSSSQLAEISNAEIVAERIGVIRQHARDTDLLQERALQAQKIALTKQTLNNISEVLGKTSSAGKAVAIASALINTYQGISAELATKTATPFEFGLKLANIASVASIGFKTVKDILATKLPSFASGGGSGGGVSTSAPSFNVVGTSGVNQLAESLQQDSDPIQAYVVGSNVTTQQALDRNITETATIG